ncbi:Nudix family hydrolase [Luteimonas arsenica]|uniref:Nudix family hydrolase n=1 Tax=Luteimonas arsenica TaxID=1586242 RepID=UPI00105613D0|nr:Nudix family hydrolase [Luteimonas arsenica]
MKTVEVVAGVITDARGRVLLSRRTEGRDLAGLWEFPGGKREPGETPEAALARELQEELGIEARIGGHLITVPQAYPGKRLRLDVRSVTRWDGIPRGREGQALAWVPPHKLPSYTMPPADIPVVGVLLQPDRYAISPEPDTDGTEVPAQARDGWLAGLDATLAAGVSRIQVRLPGLDAGQRRGLLAAAAERCRAAGAELLVNADVALAQEFGLGLHLRASQLVGMEARPRLAEGALLAASCHDEAELAHAARLGCDFAVLGAVKPTATHTEQPGIGWEAFARLREGVSLPIYALGGLGPDDLEDARRNGAQGIAAIRSLWHPG